MNRLILFLTVCLLCISSALFADDSKHELDNMHVTINAKDFKSSRFLNITEYNGKAYISGKPTSYNRNGKANGGKLVWPYAEYELAAKMAGGAFNVTVHYRINKEKATDDTKILVGMDLLEDQELPVKGKLINSVRTTFNVKLLRGKKHTVKIWLPSEGVEIQRIEVRRSFIKKN